MKAWERLVGLLAGLMLFLVSCVFFLLAIGQAEIFNELFRISSLNHWTGSQILWAYGIAFLSLLLTVLLVRMSLRVRRREKTVINQTQFGEIQITISAIESLVLRATRKIKGVKDAHVGIRADLTGLDIFIEITVNPDLSIPNISEEIRTKVDEYVYETIGIRVNSIKVLVTKVAGELKTRVE